MADPNTQLIKFLKILSDETRLNILEQLNDGKKSSKQLEKLLGKKQSTVSHHLTSLIEFNLIESEIKEIEKKKINIYSVKNDEIFKLLSQIRNFIESANIKEFLERKKKELYDILI